MISDVSLRKDQEIRFVRRFDRDALATLLRGLDPSLFDGHTEFSGLSAEERLKWISEIAFFVTRFCGVASIASAGMV